MIDNLQKRGFYVVNICVLCKEDEESVRHLLSHCKYTWWVRQNIFSSFSLIGVGTSSLKWPLWLGLLPLPIPLFGSFGGRISSI